MQLNKAFVPADANLTGFASNVTGATFTLTANDSGDSLAHRVSIRNDSATDHSGKTVTLVGTDQDGKALTEVVTGPAGSATVESVGYFLTLESATPSATIGADTFDIGWVDEFVTNTLAMNWRGGSTAVVITPTGTINYTLERTLSDFQNSSSPVLWGVDDEDTQSGVTDALGLRWEVTPRGIRVVVNSYSSGATLQLDCVQSDV
jgi:hypothetical protein